MSDTEKFKHNRDSLEAQQREFTKGGALLKNLFGVSAKHPIISIIFALSFGALVNAVYDFASYPLVNDEATLRGVLIRAVLTALFALVCFLLVARLKSLHSNMFVYEPLSQKKLLVTLVSKGKRRVNDTTAYVTYQSLLYTASGHAEANSLKKVILVTTELAEVKNTAEKLAKHIEASGRQAEIHCVVIEGRSSLEIQNQLELLFQKLEAEYSSSEIIADYTGGTKDMSVALYKASEKRLITPVYLNAATDGEYGKASA